MAQIFCLLDALYNGDFVKILELVWCGFDINCRDSYNRTVLHHLIEIAGLGDYVHHVISRLVDLGANFNARDINGRTPLHNVLSPAYAEIVGEGFKRSKNWFHKTEEELDEMIDKRGIATLRLLVKLGADVNARFNLGVTSLTRAVQFGNIRAVEMLIKLGVSVNSELMINWSSLHSAVKYGNKHLVECLVGLGADMESKSSLVSPLHIAIKTQNLDMIKVLIQNGDDVNWWRDDNITPIMLAVNMKSKEMIDTLAQLGADINSKVSSSSVIVEIVKSGKTDMLQTLFKAFGQNVSINLWKGQKMVTALGTAVEESDFKMAEFLVKHGADVNVRYEYSCPPLFTAARLGQVDMVTELVRLEKDFNKMKTVNTTALMRAVDKACPTMLDLLLAHGGDVNLTYSLFQTIIQDAVSRGDTTQVKTLAKLGADIHAIREERIGLLQHALQLRWFGGSVHEQHSMEIIKMLVQAGINLNKRKTNNLTTLLHDAVKLGDREMVHILAELGIDVDQAKNEGFHPLFIAAQKGSKEIIEYLVSKGANINQSVSLSVTPLHDAVLLGDVDMVSTLIDCGADKTASRWKATALYSAILNRDKGTVKCLLECGADKNKVGMETSLLHDAIDNADLRMIDTLESLGVKAIGRLYPALHQTIQSNCYGMLETFLMFGADVNMPHISLLECATSPCQLGANVDNRGIWLDYPLHAACVFGHIDLVRLLILEGGDVDKCDSDGKKPLAKLPLVSHVDYHVIKDLLTSSSEVLFEPRKKTTSLSECKIIKHWLCTPGIGDVKYIPTPQSSEISSRVYKVLDMVTTSCRGQLKAIGSAAEGTKVELPTEMDFMIEIKMKKDEEEKTIDKGNGFIKYEYVLTALMDDQLLLGSADFHEYIIEPIFKAVRTGTPSDDKISFPKPKVNINENDRKACSPTTLVWGDGNSKFDISVDLVPCLHVNNWPEGAKTKTWLMDCAELRSHGYVLVPKPPHVKSDLAKEYTANELQTLWKVSFPHLETKHMQHLEQRVKDVYTTAKCLRNPDVCRILIRDDGTLPRPVDKYITSYLLKMCFFENVEYFLDNQLSLEAMVCKVYQDLVVRLSEGFVPIFFLPKVNALGGGKQDAHKCVQVARSMAQFVRALYLRDSASDVDTAICGEDEEITVYQRKPTSVYKVHDINTTICEENEEITVYQRNPTSVYKVHDINGQGFSGNGRP